MRILKKHLQALWKRRLQPLMSEIFMIKPNLQIQRLSDIIDAITDGVAVIDLNWKIVLWNKTAVKISGYGDKNIMGGEFRSIIKIVREQDGKESYNTIQTSIKSGKVNYSQDNTLLVTKNKGEIPITLSASPLFGREGKVDGIVIAFNDITLQKEAFRLRSDFTYLQ